MNGSLSLSLARLLARPPARLHTLLSLSVRLKLFDSLPESPAPSFPSLAHSPLFGIIRRDPETVLVPLNSDPLAALHTDLISPIFG